MKRAERAMRAPVDSDKLREAFETLSTELRDQPDAATAEGWWLRGRLAAALLSDASNPTTLASVALDSFHEALQARADAPRDVSALLAIHAALLPLTAKADGRAAASRYEAAEQLLIVLDLLQRIEQRGGEPIDAVLAARTRAAATEAALDDGKPRIARELFLTLDDGGGFIEPLALRVAAQLDERLGAHQAFLFFTELLERHPTRRRLLIDYIELCARNGWQDEAKQGLGRAVEHMKSSYEDDLFLATYFAQLGDPTRALKHYRDAIRRVPRGFEANLGYAALLAALADEADARQTQLREANEELLNRRRSDDADALRERLDAEDERIRAQRVEARAVISTALAQNPDNIDALALLATLHRALGDDEAATEDLERRLAAAREQAARQAEAELR